MDERIKMPSYLRMIYGGLNRFDILLVRQKLAIISGLADNYLGKQALQAHMMLAKYEYTNRSQAL